MHELNPTYPPTTTCEEELLFLALLAQRDGDTLPPPADY